MLYAVLLVIPACSVTVIWYILLVHPYQITQYLLLSTNPLKYGGSSKHHLGILPVTSSSLIMQSLFRSVDLFADIVKLFTARWTILLGSPNVSKLSWGELPSN